jgi:CheY-like chemotaxis protein
MTIIIAHKPINRSDIIGVIWNHIICTAAVPYNKKVTIFPCQSAPCTFPVFHITRHPLTTIYSSLPAIITIKRSICGKRVNRQINIAACVSLSATGSSIFPKLLILWNLLAIYPSARSVRPDSNKIHQLFQKVLEKNGYQVKSASDGAQALEVLDKEYIDLIISDIMMPVMDGYELVSELRSAGYQIPVLMITAKGSFDDMRQGFLSGSDDYMVKPVNVNERQEKYMVQTGMER